MKKIKFIGLLIIILGLFFSVESKLINVDAFDLTTECQPPLTTFSDGSSTFDISFPPGGGTTCDTIADCPTITLPDNATIFSMKVDMELTDPALEIGTPYIWIPNSNSNSLAQIRTSNGTLVKLFTNGDTASCGGTASFNNPSRITVMPGGDVWVGNRNNSTVTRLSPKEGIIAGGTCGNSICNVGENNGSCPQDCEEYEVNCNYGVGGGPRGVTYDINGKIWVSGTGDTNMYKFNLDGSLVWGPKSFGIKTYGMIGDASGYVWVADNQGGARRACRINIDTEIKNCTDISKPYGIGIDNEGDIWFGNCSGGGVIATQIGGVDSGFLGSNITPGGLPGSPVSGYSCGLAADQNNVIWITHCGVSPGKVWAVKQDGSQLTGSPFQTGNLTRGIAVDFDGNIWAVNRNGGAPGGNPVLNPSGCGGLGSVTKLASDGSYIATYKTCGNNPYCYSDMTGLRTVPKTITIGSSGSIPLSNTGTFEICSDPLAPPLCSDSSDCDALFLPTSCGDPSGFCEISLEIFSMQAGDYTLKNLEVVYGKQVPITTGGLVPCGRDWNDDATPWDDRVPCTLCHLMILLNQGMDFLMKIASVIAILAFIITGFLFIASAGNPERKNNAKESFKWIIVGFLIIFLSWLFIDFLLSAWGFLDPLGGEWKVVCE
ncbi:MAG: hypothetical protein KAQ87_03670 [Candidatus Pacebacteria bacterium]|nr:hypothetical protein [Candidatus Paceibacterota bacterium]